MSQRIVTLDSGAISAYLACPKLWKLAKHEHLRMTGEARKALKMGTVMHKLLELYYIEKLNKHLWDAAGNAIVKFASCPEARLEGIDIKFLIQRFRDYVLNYMTDDFKPVKVEKIPSTEVGFTHVFYENSRVRYLLEGKIDLISPLERDLVFIDHKTQSRYGELYNYTAQFLTYSMVTGFRKAIINYVGLQKEIELNKTFRRKLITFPEHIIESWRLRVMSVFQSIDQKLELQEIDPTIDRFKNFPNPTCGGAFGQNPCQFVSLCELHSENKEMYENIKRFKYTVEPWEPWSLEEEQ